jgi:hypothetical protein
VNSEGMLEVGNLNADVRPTDASEKRDRNCGALGKLRDSYGRWHAKVVVREGQKVNHKDGNCRCTVVPAFRSPVRDWLRRARVRAVMR